MTRLLVLSDTHGRLEQATDLLERYAGYIQGVVHLGDYARDARALVRKTPDLPFYVVRGNNDAAGDTPSELVLQLENTTLFLTHGQRYRIDFRQDLLAYAARENGAEWALFGHTHVPMLEKVGDVTVLNPGSLSLPRSSQGPTFATLDLEAGRRPVAHLWVYAPEGHSKILG